MARAGRGLSNSRPALLVFIALLASACITACDSEQSCIDAAAPKMNALQRAVGKPLTGINTEVQRLEGCDSGDAPYVALFTPAGPTQLTARFAGAGWKPARGDKHEPVFKSPDNRVLATITTPEKPDARPNRHGAIYVTSLHPGTP